MNGGPVTKGFRRDHTEEFKKAGIPFSRLHDVEGAYGGAYFVDVPNIFRDMQRDPSDPDAYDFALTDLYIQKIYEAGTEAFYRLGTTIDHAPIKRRTAPPEDFDKWAEICAGIVRHYNEGWANGFHFGIRYWEIWNEPENHPDPKQNPCWGGTPAQFYKLYETAALRLKKEFPNIRVGAYGHCGFYSVTRPDRTGSREKYFMDFMEDFFAYIRDRKLPLDFFSWHIYSVDIEEIEAFAAIAQKTMEKYGYGEAENILNEWNYRGISEEAKSPTAASWLTGVLCALQKSPVDASMYYDASPFRYSYCGLFSFSEHGIEKPYYSMVAFNTLYQLGTEVQSQTDDAALRCIAASNGEKEAVLLSDYKVEIPDYKCNISMDITGYPVGNARIAPGEQNVPEFEPVEAEFHFMGTNHKFAVYITDKTRTLEKIAVIQSGDVLVLPPQSTLLLKSI